MKKLRTDHQICFLGLGSNQGNKTYQLNQAIKHINNLANTQLIATAHFYLSKPWGVTNQPMFTNTVVKIKTKLKPLALLKAIKTIEFRLMNRQVNQRWHSRCIDIDILLFGKLTLNRTELIIPHPFLTERCFVIKPLLELQPCLPKHLKQKLINHLSKHDCMTDLKFIKNSI